MITFVLQSQREKSLLRRHPWIFSKAIDKAIDSKTKQEVEQGK